MGSTVHCVAGDATGIIAAAAITATLGFPMWIDLIVEYAAGFAFGLFIFQALFMKDMMGGSYIKALAPSVIPEWLSMNMMMAGMAVTMIYLMMGRDMRAMDPAEPLFWLVMSLGVIVGFVTAYPVNVWMVARGLKHGLMTVRDEDHRKRSGLDHSRGDHEATGHQMNPECYSTAARGHFCTDSFGSRGGRSSASHPGQSSSQRSRGWRRRHATRNDHDSRYARRCYAGHGCSETAEDQLPRSRGGAG